MKRTFKTLAELEALVGQEVVVSDWLELGQERIDQFADATGDHQWIHVDPQRAAVGPFGTTIAHGFLTLALVPKLLESALEFEERRMGINYGLNKVRFTAPVPVDSLLRGRFTLKACEPVDNGGRQMTWSVTLERQGQDKPVCVAEFLARQYP